MDPASRLPPDPAEWAEIRFLQAVSRRLPQDRVALSALATLLTQHGMFEQGLVIDEQLAETYPEDAGVVYDFACSLCLVGRREEALSALERALGLGFGDVDWMMQDDDLMALREDPGFLRLLAPYRAEDSCD